MIARNRTGRRLRLVLALATVLAAAGCTQSTTATPTPTPTALQRFDAAVDASPACQGPVPACFTILHKATAALSLPPQATSYRDALEAAITRLLADCAAVRQAQPAATCSASEGGLAGDEQAVNAAIAQLRTVLASSR